MSRLTRNVAHRFPLKAPVALLLSMQLCHAFAQTAAPTDLTVIAPAFAGQSINKTTAIEVRLSRDLTAADGVVAICIGPLDLSQKTKVINANTFRAETDGVELPAGSHEVVVHLIRGNEWIDLAKFPVTIESETNAKSALDAKFTVGLKAQIHERVSGTTKRGQRPEFQDTSFTSALNWEGKPLGWNTKTSANIKGVSFRNEAVQFPNAGVDAHKLDLNDYKLEFERGAAKFAVGHLAYGNHPMLLNNFDSRGLSVGYAITSWLDVSASALRATSIVGVDNFFGLDTVDHRIYATTLGIELFPEKKGLLRSELSLLDGKALPQSNVGRGQVPDAEQSRGFGVRLLATDPNGRWKLDSLWARSRYLNPTHPELAQGSELVPVKSETRDAYQAEASYQLVKDAKWIGDKHPINLRVIAHYAYAEPLFKSLGANFIADQRLFRYTGELRAGEIALTLFGSEKNDNVKTIPTILKTGTYERSGSLSAPLNSLFGTSEKPANHFPQMQLESRRVRQYTLRIPDGTNARSSFWPDQVNYTHKAALNWSYEPYTIGYTLEVGDQDNRQPGRESADFLIHTHGLTVGWRVNDKLNVNLGYNRSRNFSYEKSQASYNNGGTAGFEWMIADAWSIKGDYAKAIAYDSLNQQYSNTLTGSLQVSRTFSIERFGRKFPGQAFMRVAQANNRALDSVVAQVLSGKQTLWQAGVSLNF